MWKSGVRTHREIYLAVPPTRRYRILGKELDLSGFSALIDTTPARCFIFPCSVGARVARCRVKGDAEATGSVYDAEANGCIQCAKHSFVPDA